MTDRTFSPDTGAGASAAASAAPAGIQISAAEADRVKRRYRSESRFRLLGAAAILAAIAMLALLVTTIVAKGASAFFQHAVTLEIFFDPQEIDPQNTGDPAVFAKANYTALARAALRERFPEVSGRRDRRTLNGLLSSGVDIQLLRMVQEDPSLIGKRVKVVLSTSDDVDSFLKGHIDRDLPEADRRVKDIEIAWLDALEGDGAIHSEFNISFWTQGDSREPEIAGFWGAMVGSFFTLVVTLAISFPIGVLAATYLEEYAPKNRLTDFIEVNINNLAAVPSIVFGLLGLAVFLNVFGLPRSAPLVGGMVLALMTLPTIIIASRAALKAVPPSIREAAPGIGASRLQVVTHHVVPLALPGIMTGTIIGMAQALGETAPLLMIGMVAFIVDVPGGITDPSTVMPVQIYLWADSPERAFVALTSAGIMALLGFLILMNALAVLLRKRFERRW